MNWDAVGAIAESLGAIGIVVTLFLLWRQTSENTKSLKSSTSATYMQAYSSMLSGAADPERARIIRIGYSDPDALTDDEAMSFTFTLGQMTTACESIFEQSREGSTPSSHWAVMRNDLTAIAQTEGGKRFLNHSLLTYDQTNPSFASELRRCMTEDTPYSVLTDWRDVSN